ncbi:MAG: nitrous oxide reductase accessory protein NosL [Campylobacterales bacterium]|nr:nitrous oxide reductase accessory protein NosL [Campylobacterales bacterium]
MVWTVVVLCFALGASATEFSKQATNNAPQLIQEGPQKQWCPICGMKLPMFYKTNHAVKLTDGTKKQYCSIRCLAVDYPAIKERLGQMLVVAVDTDTLIDVHEAVYVLGSKAPGTMSMVSKYGFSTKAAAKAFQAEHGGELSDFEGAFAAANASLEKDVEMTTNKKKNMMYPKGKKLYEVKCQEIDPMHYNTISELKADIGGKNLCQDLKGEGELQPVALYLWEVKRLEHTHVAQIDVPENAKCPVCGMFVAKYPKWAAMLKDEAHTHYFDGVKDMMKFIFEPQKYAHEPMQNPAIKVTDYYTLEALDGREAFYVVGSSKYGPMGHELIPFRTKTQAEGFLKDHQGKQVVRFDEITLALVKTLD